MPDSQEPKSEAQTTLRHLLHEMRTPLGQILGYGEMLQEEMQERGHEDLVPDLERIEGAARKLLKLLSDVFEGGPAVDTEAARPPRAALDEVPGSAAPAGASGRLLVVDDEPQNRDLLTRRLRKRGYEVAAVAEGREALHALEAGAFDLMLLDVLMPGMSGLEVLEAIRTTRSASEFPVIMATALGGSDDVVEALRHGANDYVTKPFDMPVLLARIETQLSLQRASREIAGLAQQLEIRNAFIRRTFGRYVSDDVVTNLLESPEGLEIRGEKRRVTILMSDLRGFSGLTETLSPTQVVSLLNGYLGTMAEVIQAYGGTVDEFLGDAVLAFFGAPVSRADDAERAVAAALAMQLAMASVNESNRRAGLPEIEMGIGIATGDVIVGNLGSERRTKYGAVGSSVNLSARIESYTLGEDVLVCDDTYAQLGPILQADAPQIVHPKGFEAPIRVHRVRGIGGDHGLALPDDATDWMQLEAELPVRFGVLEGKQVSGASATGSFTAVSPKAARLRAEGPLPELANLRIELLDGSGAARPGSFYAKVVQSADGPEETSLVRFTSRSRALDDLLSQALAGATDGAR